MNDQQTQTTPWEDIPAPTAAPPGIPDDTKPWGDISGNSELQVPGGKEPDWISKIYHPVIQGAGMTAGTAAGAILGTPAGPVGSTLAGTAMGAAMYGPSQQFANSIDELRGIQPQNSSMMGDLKSGAELTAAGNVLGTAIKSATPLAKSAIIKSISSVFGPSEEAINAWLENPSLPNSPDIVSLARKLPQTLNNLKGTITQADNQAASLLSNSSNPIAGAIPKSDILKIILDQKNSLSNETEGAVIGAGNNTAANQLQSLHDAISELNTDYIPQSGVKGLMKSLNTDIDFTDKEKSASNTVLANIRKGFNNILGDVNPDYKEAMKNVSSMMGTLEDTQDQFGITNHIGQGLQPTDSTISKLQAVTKNTKSISQDTLNDLKNLTGDDYVTDARNAQYAQQFKKGSTTGSRKVNLEAITGGAIGSGVGYMTGYPTLGGVIGAGAGAAAGALSDTFGGPMAAISSRLVQELSKHIPTALASQVVANALTPQSMLSQTQPGGQ